jgi:hypothetical protein
MSIYFATGIKIFRQRALMRSFSPSKRLSALRDSGIITKSDSDPFMAENSIVVTTQIKYDIHPHGTNSRCETPDGEHESMSSYSSTRNLSSPIHAERPSPTPSEPTSPIRQNWQNSLPIDSRRSSHQIGKYENNGYRATAFATLSSGDMAPFPVRSPPPSPRQPKMQPRPETQIRTRPTEGNNAAAYAYLKVAFLMFVALFVVWVPSTCKSSHHSSYSMILNCKWKPGSTDYVLGNRLYQYIHQDVSNYGLNLTSALVLPLQGFWNAMIYVSTTWPECKRAYGLLASKLTGDAPRWQPQPEMHLKDNTTTSSTRGTRNSDSDIPLEDIIGHGGQARHSSISNSDTVVEDGLYNPQQSR